MPMFWTGDNGVGWASWIAMSLMMIAFLALLVVAIVMVIRAAGGNREDSDRRPGSSRAAAILEERFARGEIDEHELAAGRRVLAGKGATS